MDFFRDGRSFNWDEGHFRHFLVFDGSFNSDRAIKWRRYNSIHRNEYSSFHLYSQFKLSSQDRSFSKALYRWLDAFFSSFVISAYVLFHPLGWNTGSHPKLLGPRAGTMSPYHKITHKNGSPTSQMPSNNITSAPGPAEYANVQIALALLSVYAARRLFNPTCPIFAKNHFLLISKLLVEDKLHIRSWQSS